MVGPELGVYPGLLSSKAQAFYHFALPSPRIVGRAEDPVSRLSGFPVSSAGKEFSYYAGDPSSIPRSGRSSEERDRQPTSVLGFPGGSGGKESTCNARDLGSITSFGRSPGEGKGYSLQYSCLENPMDRGAWQATVHGVAKSWT